MRLGKFSGVVCWFSGGRDSAVACALARLREAPVELYLYAAKVAT